MKQQAGKGQGGQGRATRGLACFLAALLFFGNVSYANVAYVSAADTAGYVAGEIVEDTGEEVETLEEDTQTDVRAETQTDTQAEATEAEKEAAAAERANQDQLGYVAGEVLVVYEKNVSDADLEEVVEDREGTVEKVLELDQDKTLAVVSIDEDSTVATALAELAAEPEVAYVQPNYIYTVEDTQPLTTEASAQMTVEGTTTAVDGYPWYKSLIGDPESAGIAMPTNIVRVAVIDTGVYSSGDYVADILNTELSVAVDSEGNIGTYQTPSGTHGTNVSTIWATTAGDCMELVSVDVSYDGENITTLTAIAGMNYAVDLGARVLNLSFGDKATDLGTGDDQALQNAVSGAQAEGAVVVCAAGNKSSQETYYPSDAADALSVIALASDGETRASFSNYGSMENKISAPGVNMLTDGTGAGTSYAAPVVSAVATLVISQNQDLSPTQVKTILESTATDLYTTGYDANSGYGRVNLCDALLQAGATTNTQVSGITLSDTSLSLAKAETATLTATITPQTAENQSVIWTSSDTSVVTVDSYGNLTAVAAGTAVITATTYNGQTATCTVTVGTYRVTYDANGGSGAPASQVLNYGDSLTIPTTQPTRDGYGFVGWSTSKTATKAAYQPGGSYTYKLRRNLTLYAVWDGTEYTITYNANGGTGAPEASTCLYGGLLTIPTQTPTRTGYTFLGYAQSQNATTGTYKAGSRYTYKIRKNLTLYAV